MIKSIQEKEIVIIYDFITICGLLLFMVIVLLDNKAVNSYDIDEIKSLPGWSPFHYPLGIILVFSMAMMLII